MEPAVDRREHDTAGGASFWTNLGPQWSPPLIGGSTPRHVARHLDGRAAMEPAVDRREHPLVLVNWLACGAAAMEPAVDRREHRLMANASAVSSAGRNGARR